MHFDLIDLRLFVRTLEAGTITAGAERCHLTLASASARIRAMEASLGTPLLARGRRGVSATPAGSALARHARLIVQQIEHLQFDLADYAQGFKGQVRLLCNTTALTEYLPELLADFLASHPHIDIDLQEQPSLRIVHSIRQGAADLGVISDAVDSSELQTRPFCPDPLALVMPLGHALAGRETVCFADALPHEFVGLALDSALAIYLEEQALHAARRLRIRIRADSFDGVLRMVARGAGLGVVPQAALNRWQGPPAFTSQPLSDPWAQRSLLLCATDFAALPGYARLLLEALTSS